MERRVPPFQPWSEKGVWRRIFEAVSDDPDFEYLIVDSTIVRAHQHSCGAKGGSQSGHRTLAPRPDHQDPSRRSRLGLPSALRPHRRPGR